MEVIYPEIAILSFDIDKGLPVMTSIRWKDDYTEFVIENFNGYRITFEKIKGELNGKENKDS